jgi:hypothetical protein
MQIFHKLDQDTCNELYDRVGLGEMCYYTGAVDLLNGGFVDAAFQQFCSIKFACFRAGVDIPAGVQELEDAIVNAKADRWVGAPEHWRHADLAFSDERRKVFAEAIKELDELVNRCRRSPLRAVGIETLTSLDKRLSYIRQFIEPAVKKDQEIVELRRSQNKLNPCDFSQLNEQPSSEQIHPPMGRNLSGQVELQYSDEKRPVRAQGLRVGPQ